MALAGSHGPGAVPSAGRPVATTSAAAATDPRIGRPKAELDTPSLLLDLGRFEANVDRLSSAIAAGGKNWRPHSKGHKSPWIARRQMDFGAIGVTCAKVSEAEVMVDGGIPSILIAYSLATRVKLERAARLQARAEVMVCADDPFHVDLASRGRDRGRRRHPDGRRHQRRDGPDRA